MSGTQIMNIICMFCVSYSIIRETSYSGIFWLVLIFTGKGSSRLGPAAGGIVCGFATALVVELLDSDLRIAPPYLRSKSLSKTSTLSKLSTSVKWCGIVNGNMQYETIPVLKKTRESWKQSEWLVYAVRQGWHMKSYCQLARSQNLLYAPNVYVNFIFADRFFNLQMEYNCLLLKDNRELAEMVADTFSGNGGYGNYSIKQTDQTAMSLSRLFVKIIKDGANREKSKTCLQCKDFNKHRPTTVQIIINVFECCPVSRVSSHVIIKGKKLNYGSEAWVHKDCSNKYNSPLPILQLNEYFQAYSAYCCIVIVRKCSLRVGKRMKTLLTFFEDSQWHVKRTTLKDNMLRYTGLDKELEEIQGIDGKVLPCLLTAYWRHYPDKASELLESCGRRTDSSLESDALRWTIEDENNFRAHAEVTQCLPGLDFLVPCVINILECSRLYRTA